MLTGCYEVNNNLRRTVLRLDLGITEGRTRKGVCLTRPFEVGSELNHKK